MSSNVAASEETSSSILAASEEMTNFTRLARLLINGGTYVLREYLHTFHSPTALQAVLTSNVGRLRTLNLLEDQRKKLFPSSGEPPNTETFDIILLHFLLRNFCNLTAPSPTGWHDMPAGSDTSPEANIVRIKCFRNELCHRNYTCISNDEFQDKWNQISSSLVALGFDPGEIERLKTEPIDHDTQRQVDEEIKNWKLYFETRVESLEQDVQDIKGQLSSIQGSTLEVTNHGPRNYLPDKVLGVFGRQQEIQEVTEIIQRGQVPAVVITGGPGIGKTVVANKVCHELVADREYNTALLFCHLGSKTTLMDVANSMILVCSNNYSQPPENPERWLLNWSKQQKQRVTFVLDNADDVLETPDCAQFVRMLSDMRVFSGLHVNFIITSRKIIKDPSLEIKEVRLKSLSPEDATRVIFSKVPDHDIQQKLTKTEALAELCGYSPLALCMVGSLLLDYTEDKLIQSLQENPLEVLRDDESDENSVERAIKVSFDFLRKPEQEALVCISVIPGPFNADAAEAAMKPCIKSDSQTIPKLRSLKNRSLVLQPAPHRYEIHPLIKAYAKQIGRERYPRDLDQGAEFACMHFMSRLAENADKHWSKDKCKESLASFNEDRPNFEHFLQVYVSGLKQQVPNYVKTFPETLFRAISQNCVYLAMFLRPSIYEQLLEELLHISLTFGEHVSQKVELLCLLGQQSRKVGKRDKYKEYLEEAFKEFSQNSAELEKSSKAYFLNNYAQFLADEAEEGKLSQAKEHLDVSLKVCEQQTPTDYVRKAGTLLHIAREANRRNERDEAERKFSDALKLFQESLGDHIMTALSLKDLADFYLFHGERSLGSEEDRQKSIKHYIESLKMMEYLGMKDRKECILTLTNLGICYQFQDNWEEAMKLFEESLYIAERELEADHMWKIYVKTQMAFWWKKKGEMEKAKELKNVAIQMSNKLELPNNRPPNKFLLEKI